MAIKIKTDTAPDERKKSAGFSNRSHAVGSEMDAKGGAVPSGGDNQRDEAGATPAPLQVANDTPSRTFRTRAPNNTFDRKAYMAEYMRQYNAKKKAKKQNDVD